MPIAGAIKVDGVLNEPEWRTAPLSSDFTMIEPQQGAAPNFATEIRVLYNRQFVYFGIFSKDKEGKSAIRATDFKRDFNARQHDHIALHFDGFKDNRNSMTFVSNAYGVQRDLLSFDDIYYDLDWDGVWKVRTNRTDSGWYAEIAIPWQTLRYPKSSDSLQTWGFNAYRNRRLTNEGTAFSSYPRAYTSTRMDYAGLISNLQPPPPKPNVRLQPYALNALDIYNRFDSSVKPRENKVKIGGEVKWAINPNSVLDLTVNTDFAQADVDRQVNNVTRFNVLFPERRQFFLENASLFGPGVGPSPDLSGGNMRIQPFFSRRIGLDDAGNPIPIDGGGRYVYRSTKRNFGAIAMRQREYNGYPATNSFVGRYSENFGEQNRIGGLITVKNQKGSNNIVSAVDGFFRISEKHSLSTMLAHSSTSNTKTQGFAGYGQYYYTNNQWKLWWTQSVVTKDFNPEMGFISRSDVIGTNPGIFWYYRGNLLPFKKFIRAFEPGVMTEFYHQASSGKLLERQLTINPIWFNFQKGGYFGYIVNPTFQRLVEPFSPLGVDISPGEFNYVRHSFYASTDPSRILSLNVNYEFGTYFNGRLNSSDINLLFAPLPHISLAARFNRNELKQVGDSAQNKTVDLFSITGRLALNPRVQLIGFYQANSTNKAQNLNIRLSWEYRPLSFIYLVYNHRGFDNVQIKRQTEDHVIAKISFLKQL